MDEGSVVEMQSFQKSSSNNNKGDDDIMMTTESKEQYEHTIERRRSVVKSTNSPRSIQQLRRSMKTEGTQAFLRPKHAGDVGWKELLNDYVASMNEINKGKQFRQTLVLYPDTFKYKFWNLIVFLSLIYTTIITPIQAALWKDETLIDPLSWPLWFTADRIVDVVFILDIVATFRVAIPDDSGQYWFDAQLVAGKYRGSIRFIIDVIAAVPWELALAIAEYSTAERMVRLVKLLRVHRLWMILGYWEKNLNVQNGLFQLLTFSTGFFMVVHIVACGWIMCSYTIDDDSERWINENDADGNDSKIYAISVYWTLMTLSTIGYGDITPKLGNNGEMWYTVVVFVLGAVTYSYVLSKIIEWTQDKDKKEFEQSIFDLDAYMRELQFNPSLVDRIWRYCFFVREKRLLGRKSRALSLLSPSLQKEAAVASYFSALDHNPLIEHLICSPESVHILQLITEISTRLRIELFGPDEVICNFGDKANGSMYMVRDGRVLLKNGTTENWLLLQGMSLSLSLFHLLFSHISLLITTPGYKTSLIRAKHEDEVYDAPVDNLKRAVARTESFSETYTSTFSTAEKKIQQRKQSTTGTENLLKNHSKVPPYCFGEENIVFKHNSTRTRATSLSFCNILSLSRNDMIDIWHDFPEAHCIAKKYCIKRRLRDLAQSGKFSKWLRDISGTFGLKKGVRVKIVKPKSRFADKVAIIIDMNWSGRIKVRMKEDGSIKSYLPNHLQVLSLDHTKERLRKASKLMGM